MSKLDPESRWIIPANVVHLPDGSTLVKPGKAVLRATGSRTAALTGVHKKTLAALADCGLITRERPSPGKCFFYPGEVEALLKKTGADPDYWNEVRTRAYLTGKNLAESKPS